MSKYLVAYFSATGTTANVAKALAQVVKADLYEIKPEVAYTNEDLNWNDKKSRSSLEMSKPDFRPKIANGVDNIEQYDTIFVGFPIWWYVAPNIINTFLESYNLSGKRLVTFATSGGSGMGKTVESLKPSVSENVKIVEGKVLSSRASVNELSKWVAELEVL